MEHSYRRYLTERNGNPQSVVHFLDSGDLEAFFRNFVPGQKLVWPCSMRLALQSELVKFALSASTSKAK